MESDVGIFWDISCLPSEPNYRCADFAYDLLVLSQSFCAQKRYKCARVFGTQSYVDFEKLEAAKALGFEVVTLGVHFDGILNQVIVSILLWLWDCERIQPGRNPCLVIACNHRGMIPVLSQLKNRNVFIVVILDLAVAERDLWKNVSNVIVNVVDSSFQYDTSELSLQSPSMPTSSSSSDLLGYSLSAYDSSSADFHSQSGFDRFSIASPPVERVDSPSAMSFNIAQNSLTLLSSQPDQNIPWRVENRSSPAPQYTVAADMMMTSKSMRQPIPVSKLFQAPMQSQGAPRDPQVIPRDEQRVLQEDLASAIRSRSVQMAVSTLRKIYTKQNKTFRIPAILTAISAHIESLAGPASPYNEVSFILSCIQWCFGGQKGDNVESFTYKMNKNIARWLIKDIQRRDLVPSLLQELVPLAVSVVQHILRQVAELDLALDLLITMQTPEPIMILRPFVAAWSASTNHMIVQRVRSFSLEIGLTPAGADVWQHGQIDRAMPRTAASFPTMQGLDPGLTPPKQSSYDDLYQLSRPAALSGPATDTSVVTQRLLTLLRKAPQGLLGARIPDIYLAEYGEPLQLQNRKLKDILLSLDSVEMVGIDGPGDKLFRIIDNTSPVDFSF